MRACVRVCVCVCVCDVVFKQSDGEGKDDFIIMFIFSCFILVLGAFSFGGF